MANSRSHKEEMRGPDMSQPQGPEAAAGMPEPPEKNEGVRAATIIKAYMGNWKGVMDDVMASGPGKDKKKKGSGAAASAIGGMFGG